MVLLLSNWKGCVILNIRVKLLRNKLNMSQEAFAKRLGVTAAGISKIENGKRKLTEQMHLMICKEFNLNESWLRTGEGEIFQQMPLDGLEQLVKYHNLDELDRKIIYEYTMLEEKKRQVIKDYIMRVAYANRYSDILTDGNVKTELLRCAEGSEIIQ